MAITPEEKKTEIKNYDGKRKEVFVDFNGTSQEYAKALIAEDSYKGAIEAASLIDVPAYNQPGITEKKVVIQVKLEGEGSDNVTLPLYANPIVKKSSGTKGYSNSKLYDLLVNAGELEEAKKQHEALETFEGLVGFLDARLKGRRVKALVKNRRKGTDSVYSSIGDILRFEPTQNQKEAKELL